MIDINEAVVQDYLERMRKGGRIEAGSPDHSLMYRLSQRALEITAVINGSYHGPVELRALFSKLIGKEVPDNFNLFPPFHTDCGLNIFLGEHVFINSSCHFQDQGGINLDDGVLIGPQVVIATVNHGLEPGHRADNLVSAVHIKAGAWIGAHATILPGVTVGEGAVVAAGAVVTKDVPARSVVAGVPARLMRTL